MNILFVSPNSPFDSIGGVERYISNLIDYCKDEAQFKTIIVLPTYQENSVDNKNNTIIYFDQSLALAKEASGREISDKAHLFSKLIEDIIVKHRIDIICAENFHIGLPPAYSLHLNMVAGLHKIPLILKLHSFAVTEIQIELVKQLMWSRISCVSKSITGDCFQKDTDVNLLSTDYLGVNVNAFNRSLDKCQLKIDLDLPSESKIILTATRILRGKKDILKEKGLINLIQAFSKISPRYPDLYLLIAIGKPSNILKNEFDQAYETLQGYIKINNIEHKTITKMFKLDEMPMVYRGSDVFALPSENETFGQVFVEAMSCGLPVIGTKVGGIPEIISDSSNGYLVVPNDSSVLAQRIETLIKDGLVTDQFIEAGIKTVADKFTAKKQFAKFIKMLVETVSISSH